MYLDVLNHPKFDLDVVFDCLTVFEMYFELFPDSSSVFTVLIMFSYLRIRACGRRMMIGWRPLGRCSGIWVLGRSAVDNHQHHHTESYQR